jgi:hypothetical protein
MLSWTASPVLDSRWTCGCISRDKKLGEILSHHELLLQVITIIVILARVDIPTSHLVAIYSIKVLLSHKCTPIILGQERSVRLLPCFVLYVRRIKIFLQCWKYVVFDIRPSTRERDIIESPKRPKFTQSRKRMINEILVCASKIVVDHPIKISFLRCKLDVDPIRSRIGDGSGSPI